LLSIAGRNVNENLLLWVGFNILILILLALDLGVFHRKVRVIRLSEAVAWSVIWVVVALLFNVWVYYAHRFAWVQFTGANPALEYFTGYLIERALSIDNIFVFLVIFSYFGVQPQYQYRVLFWGILGALIMRGLMIWLGVELISRFEWVLYIFGAFLVWTGFELFRHKASEVDPSKNPVLRLARKYLRVTHEYHGERFFVVQHGLGYATPLFLVLLVVETTDVAFALDSIPAIFGITRDPFIIYSSNVFAILGLRALYFLLAGVMNYFRYLNAGLAIVLIFIGAKMLLEKFVHISIYLSLGIVGAVLGVSILASIVAARREARAQQPR
jgi:tellurite resistance protein TerC